MHEAYRHVRGCVRVAEQRDHAKHAHAQMHQHAQEAPKLYALNSTHWNVRVRLVVVVHYAILLGHPKCWKPEEA